MSRTPVISLTLFGIALVTMGLQCHKDQPQPIPTFNYVEKLTLRPYKKTYAINDTIWLQFQTADKTLFDKLSNSRKNTDTTFLRMGFNLHRRLPIDNTVELFSDAKVESGLDVNFVPVFTRYNTLNFKTHCSSSNYFFKVAIVPKRTGVYSIEPSAVVTACPTKVTSLYSTFKFTFDLADCNKDVWLSIPPQSRGGELGFTDVLIDNKEIFVFKVE